MGFVDLKHCEFLAAQNLQRNECQYFRNVKEKLS